MNVIDGRLEQPNRERNDESDPEQGRNRAREQRRTAAAVADKRRGGRW